MKRTKWVNRIFNLGIPAGWLSNILTRLDGTAIRLRSLTENLSDEQLSLKPNGKWSIKEHIGHLIDLEELHSGRVQDFKRRKSVLRAADMSNKKTYSANHNIQSVGNLIDEFKVKRDEFIASLQNLDDDDQLFVATHPRLNVAMKSVDMAFFTAEHDDHHIASIYDIIASLK